MTPETSSTTYRPSAGSTAPLRYPTAAVSGLVEIRKSESQSMTGHGLHCALRRHALCPNAVKYACVAQAVSNQAQVVVHLSVHDPGGLGVLRMGIQAGQQLTPLTEKHPA